MTEFDFLITAGDPSGDLHGAKLITALKRLNPTVKIAAVGGPLMREGANEFLDDLAGEGIVGFLEPLLKMPRLIRSALKIKNFLKEKKPKALVCIDYYGFNRRLLGFAAEANVPAYYYISPQVWASRPYRLKVLKRFVQKAFVIFPFEEKLYRDSGISCEFVGHPLLDIVPDPVFKKTLNEEFKVGILPGSRVSELSRHLPIFLKAFELFKRRFPRSRAFVFAARGLADSKYELPSDSSVEIVRESDYQVRSQLDIAICSSGTATLENALLGIPMAVAYRLSWPTYYLARALIRVPYIAMVNILAGKEIVPELIQNEAAPEPLSRALIGMVENPERYLALKKELIGLRSLLGNPGVSERAARALLSLISSKPEGVV